MALLQSLYSLAFSILFSTIVASAPANSTSSIIEPQLEYLFRATVNVGERIQFGSAPGPLGMRASFPILGGSFAGPGMSVGLTTNVLHPGELLPIGADWGLVDARGEFAVDAYYQLRTSDNVDIFAHSQGPPQPSNTGDRLKTRITLETGDENYYWVNNMLVVGVTTVGNGFLTVDAWQVTQGD